MLSPDSPYQERFAALNQKLRWEVADELRRANLARVDELHPPATPRDSFYTRHGKRALDVGDARLGQRRDNLTGERRRALTLGRVGGSSDAVAHALRHVLRNADGGRRCGLRSHGSTLGRATDNVLTLK
mgnify:CR=1 FL=1